MTIHGLCNSKIYRRWIAMRARCNNPNHSEYFRYGGRGIKVCKEWEESFMSFYEWATNNGYEEGLTIDRIDNNKGYSPENCRWATVAQQNRNCRRNHLVTYNGETKCIADWVIKTGLSYDTILYRLKIGIPLDKVFDKDNRRYRMITCYGKTQTISAWAKEIGITTTTIRQRIRNGKTPEQALKRDGRCIR